MIRIIISILLILMMAMMTTCDKVDYKKGQVGFYTLDSDQVPVYINIQTNEIAIINNANDSIPSCGLAPGYVELNEGSYDIIMYGRKSTKNTRISIEEDKCKLIEF